MLARSQVIPSIESAHVPAGTGGLNLAVPASAMGPQWCTRLYNMIAAEYGLRARLGFKEWNTGLTGVESDAVRTIIPFAGSTANGTNDRLFATTSKAIYPASSSGAAPAASLALPSPPVADTQGWGISCTTVTAAGHFCLYADEAAGLYVYTEVNGTWARGVKGATVVWSPTTAYLAGDLVTNDSGKQYVCTIGGTSAGSGGPTGTGLGITDGSVTWNYSAAASTTLFGTSLSDQHAGLTFDPARIVFAMVWKNRLWFVEKDSARAWYMPVGSLYGTATSFSFGMKFRSGGTLVGLWNWTIDGGSGMDDRLVGISASGDVVVYAGSNPDSPISFGAVGAWYVGGVPAGRRIATQFGGDLLILSKVGLIPMSALCSGKQPADHAQYVTAPIGNLFNAYMLTGSSYRGWSVAIHPEDNALIVTVPVVATPAPGPAQYTQLNQLAMNMTTHAWSEYRGLPMVSCEAWGGQFYFGTPDGRVCLNTGYVDNNLLSNPNSYSAVDWRVITAFQSLGSARMKQVEEIRPTFLADAAVPAYTAQARYNYDLSDAPAIAPDTSTGWDASLWDVAVWGGDLSPVQKLGGAVGMGTTVAIALRGSSTCRTILVGIDVLFRQGGLL